MRRRGMPALRPQPDRAGGGGPLQTLPLLEIDAESLVQSRSPGRGQSQDAAVALAVDPAQLQAAVPDRRADQTGDVVAALAPIEAGPAEDALAARLEAGAEAGQEPPAQIGD